MWVEGRGHLPGQLVVVSGPSGSGKSTVIRGVLERAGLDVRLSVSATTREPRPGEQRRGRLLLPDRDEFQDAVDRGEFLEWAEYNGNSTAPRPGRSTTRWPRGSRSCSRSRSRGRCRSASLRRRRSSSSSRRPTFRGPRAAAAGARDRDRAADPPPARGRPARNWPRPTGTTSSLINDDLDRCVEEFVTILKTIRLWRLIAPMLEELKEEKIVNKVGGRFKLSTLIQKRMIALNQGARPLVDLRGRRQDDDRDPGDHAGQDLPRPLGQPPDQRADRGGRRGDGRPYPAAE